MKRLLVRSFLVAFTVAVVFLGLSAVGRADLHIGLPILDVATRKQIVYPSFVTVFDNQMYFRARTEEPGSDVQLWRSNGVTAEMAANVSMPSYLGVYNGSLYFSSDQGGGALKLWQYTPGAGASAAPGGAAANLQNPESFTSFGDKLYFRATRYNEPSNIGTELWVFDGATQTPIDMYPGSGSSCPQHFIEYNTKLYFNACGAPGQGTELWCVDKNGVRANAATIRPGDGSSPENFAVYNNKLYFSAYDGAANGRQLWSYDSTTAQAKLATDMRASGVDPSSNPSNLCTYNGKLYFSATDGTHGYELWSFDGSVAKMVAEINLHPDPLNGDTFEMDSAPGNLTVFNNKLYFGANDGVHGRELWSFDGQTAALVADINPGQYGSDVKELTVFGDSLYFSADSGYMSLHNDFQPSVMRLSATAVPEPSTWLLLATGTLALLFYRSRRRQGASTVSSCS